MAGLDRKLRVLVVGCTPLAEKTVATICAIEETCLVGDGKREIWCPRGHSRNDDDLVGRARQIILVWRRDAACSVPVGCLLKTKGVEIFLTALREQGIADDN